MPYQGWAKASVIGVGAGVYANCRGDVSVGDDDPAGGTPHQENRLHWDSYDSAVSDAAVKGVLHLLRLENGSDAAWRSRHLFH